MYFGLNSINTCCIQLRWCVVSHLDFGVPIGACPSTATCSTCLVVINTYRVVHIRRFVIQPTTIHSNANVQQFNSLVVLLKIVWWTWKLEVCSSWSWGERTKRSARQVRLWSMSIVDVDDELPSQQQSINPTHSHLRLIVLANMVGGDCTESVFSFRLINLIRALLVHGRRRRASPGRLIV